MSTEEMDRSGLGEKIETEKNAIVEETDTKVSVFVENPLQGARKKKKFVINEKRGQKIIFWMLMALVVLLPVSRMITYRTKNQANMIIPSIFLITFFVCSLIIIVIESIYKRVPWRKYALCYACMIIPWLFSFVVSFDTASLKLAFLGLDVRGEGLLQMGSYCTIFILSSLLVNQKYRASIIYVFISIVSIFSVMGVFQFLNIYSFGSNFKGMASYPIGNPNFYSTLTVLFAGIVMAGYWLYQEESSFLHPFPWWNRMFWLLLVVVSYIGCISARSSSAYAGLIMIFLLLVFLDIISKRKGFFRICLMLLLLIGVMFALNLLSDGSVWGEINENITAVKNEGTILGDTIGSNRMKIWKDVVGLLPMYWLYGCGIEQLGFVYLVVYGLNEYGQMIDKAHNEYLNIWVTQGIIPIVLYLIFLFALFIPGLLQFIKKKRYETDDIRMMAIVPFFGYIAQAFFNIRMPSVAPYFWLICGFLLMSRKADLSDEMSQGEVLSEDIEGKEIQES